MNGQAKRRVAFANAAPEQRLIDTQKDHDTFRALPKALAYTGRLTEPTTRALWLA